MGFITIRIIKREFFFSVELTNERNDIDAIYIAVSNQTSFDAWIRSWLEASSKHYLVTFLMYLLSDLASPKSM